MTLAHPHVASSQMTCPSVPEQYEGQLLDGRRFYFRYRFGVASVGVGATEDAAVEDSFRHEKRVGDSHDGQWVDEIVRDAVFADLLRAAEMGA